MNTYYCNWLYTNIHSIYVQHIANICTIYSAKHATEMCWTLIISVLKFDWFFDLRWTSQFFFLFLPSDLMFWMWAFRLFGLKKLWLMVNTKMVTVSYYSVVMPPSSVFPTSMFSWIYQPLLFNALKIAFLLSRSIPPILSFEIEIRICYFLFQHVLTELIHFIIVINGYPLSFYIDISLQSLWIHVFLWLVQILRFGIPVLSTKF